MEVRRQQRDRTSPLLAHSPDESHIAKSLLSSSQVALDNRRSRGEAAVAPPRRKFVSLLPYSLLGTLRVRVWCGVAAFWHFSGGYVKNRFMELPLARRASRIVDVDARISQRASGWASELLDFITARPKHREQTARSTHVPCANNHEIRFATAQVLFDFWKPVAISSVDKASA